MSHVKVLPVPRNVPGFMRAVVVLAKLTCSLFSVTAGEATLGDCLSSVNQALLVPE